MLVQIETVKLAFFRHPQQSGGVDAMHDRQGNRESADRDCQAADRLSNQHLCAAAVEQTLQRGGVVGGNRPG